MRWQQLTGIGRSLDPRYPPHRAMMLSSAISGVVFGMLSLLTRHPLWQSALTGTVSAVAVAATWVFSRELDPDHESSAFLGIAIMFVALVLSDFRAASAPLLPAIILLLSYVWLILMLRILDQTSGRPIRWLDLLGLLVLTAGLTWQVHITYGLLATAALMLGARLPDPHPRQLFVASVALVITLMKIALSLLNQKLSSLVILNDLTPLVTVILLVSAFLFFPVILAYYQTSSTDDRKQHLLIPLRIQATQVIALATTLLFASWQGEGGLLTFLPLWAAILGITLYRFLPQIARQWLAKHILRQGTGVALLSLLLIGCQPTAAPETATATRIPMAQVALMATEAIQTTSPIAPSATPTALLPPPTLTPIPTSPPTATPEATATPTATLTPTPVAICSDRMPGDDLLTIVTLQYGLSRDYQPADLVPLADYFSTEITLGYPTEIRQIMAEPLVQLINDMQSLGLRPFIISGYRSYSAQAIARQKWVEKAPEYVDFLSAPAGHSEHQLGTVIDFGSPELPEIVGLEDVEFHTYFYMTSEGIWLTENAHRYGFTLSYPREAQETTGFFYEPWHYRYVGVEMATRLREMGVSLTEFQLMTQPLPCLPEASE